jgi:crotonobetainyl-CoA:carnitine CoA-transferase CaiB-like acyl-CoA transferase
VRVVEIGIWVAGPAAGGVLADWGADVIKIEPPGIGDPARSFGQIVGGDLPFSPPFEMDNRGKRSIIINLLQAEGQNLAFELIDQADVFLTNLRMVSLARSGLDYASLLKRNPRLIYGAINGYGLEGPDADRPAYDIAAFWARSGIASALTQQGGDPPFQRGGMGDHNAGQSMAGAICAALYAREKTGQGQLVSTSLLRQGLYMISFDLSIALRFGLSLQAGNRETMMNPSINNYQDSEGKRFWIVGLDGERHWPPLARAVGRPEWLEDPRFASAADRAANAPELIRMLDEIFATKTREEWAEIFDTEEDFWWAPVQTLDEVLADPQVRAGGGLVEVPDGATTTTLPATPADFAGTPWAPRSMAPGHGEHTSDILAELGRTTRQIEELRTRKVVG